MCDGHGRCRKCQQFWEVIGLALLDSNHIKSSLPSLREAMDGNIAQREYTCGKKEATDMYMILEVGCFLLAIFHKRVPSNILWGFDMVRTDCPPELSMPLAGEPVIIRGRNHYVGLRAAPPLLKQE